jgi:hypothetical protein
VLPKNKHSSTSMALSFGAVLGSRCSDDVLPASAGTAGTTGRLGATTRSSPERFLALGLIDSQAGADGEEAQQDSDADSHG